MAVTKRKQIVVHPLAMPVLLEFLNVTFQPDTEKITEEIRKFLPKLGQTLDERKRQLEIAWDVQHKFLRLLTPIAERQGKASKALERLVDGLNQWALKTKVHPHWHLSLFVKNPTSWEPDQVTTLKPGQAVMQIAAKQWVVDMIPQLGGVYTGDALEGRVWVILARCLETGELGRLKRCRLCSRFFSPTHMNQDFCGPEHQKQHDNYAATKRMRKFREIIAAQESALREQQEGQQFAAFLRQAKRSVKGGSQTALFIKRRLPQGWNTPWLNDSTRSPGDIW